MADNSDADNGAWVADTVNSPDRRARAGPGRLALLAGSSTALVIASLLGCSLAMTNKWACRAGAWNGYLTQFQAHCYTDIYPLYYGEGLSVGKTPYLSHPVEYPVLIGGAMQAIAWLVHPIGDPYARGREFFDLTCLLLTLFAVAGVLATAYLAGWSRRWTALGVALSPALILSAFTNWDLIAVSLTMLGLAAWAARRQVLAGVLIGLAIATKFYPLLFLGPLLLLCLRAGRMRQFWITAGSAAAAWLVVNVPIMIAAPSGWARFYQLSETRGADWGSIWYFFETERWSVVGTTSLHTLNALSLLVFVVGCLGIVLLTLAAPVRPRVAQVLFLVLAVFLMSNKVWSPQYVSWLVPLVVLARPRFGAYALWQLAEVGYFFAIWSYLITVSVSGTGAGAVGGISSGLYFAAVLARFLTVLLLCVLVLREVLKPARDVVRAGGEDDPAGGVLSGAGDRFVLKLRRRQVPQPEPASAP